MNDKLSWQLKNVVVVQVRSLFEWWDISIDWCKVVERLQVLIAENWGVMQCLKHDVVCVLCFFRSVQVMVS